MCENKCLKKKNVLGATRNLERGTVLLIVSLQFSDFLQFGNLAIWSHFGEWNHNPNRNVLFLEKFEQTKIVYLQALPEIWKSWETEILSKILATPSVVLKQI